MIEIKNSKISFETFKNEVVNDYRLVSLSRETSILGRKEVLTGKAKFGIFGDGKELPQIAMSKVFKKGDFRSGYYRDQTFMMAIGALSPEQLFAGLYAHTDGEAEPMSAGRQMGGHFNTDFLNSDGSWKNLVQHKNSSSDVSCTASQMPRLVGLAHASKLYRNLFQDENFSINGNEVAWGTIGNASTSEGLFFESVNAAVVLQIPMVISIWDDGYGISVSNEYQTAKESISEALSGFRRTSDQPGAEIFEVKGWDYPALINAYERAHQLASEQHIPIIIHVTELTQPQGHSTSGSHERYKSEKRLAWEREFDCNLKFKEWIISHGFATKKELQDIDAENVNLVKNAKNSAWIHYLDPLIKERDSLLPLLENIYIVSAHEEILKSIQILSTSRAPNRKILASTARKILRITLRDPSEERNKIDQWLNKYMLEHQPKFSSKLYNEFSHSVLNVPPTPPRYDQNSTLVDGRIVLKENFKSILKNYHKVLIFGEDTGAIGDVNQGLEGLQKIYGKDRVADRGIREATIIGEGIGMALRGLRPIAEIQYLDYVLYALQIMSDDLATLHYRTNGKQIAPLIIRTRGHRLEGIWHSGSQMAALIHLLRGIYILVPRNMTQASGFYNTLLSGQDPALVIESLNGYRIKEKMPTNIGEFKIPLGKVEILKTGVDITLVSYGSTLRLVLDAAHILTDLGINAEVIDIQCLIPFDLNHDIQKSLRKTNRLLVIDEDMPGGASSYIVNEILEQQNAYPLLDSPPQTLTAKAHRPAYGTDGDYFSKPSIDDIVEKAYDLIHESDPSSFPKLR